MRIGIGYDIHRLTPGRKFVLGGVEFSFHKGLAGHSDGDVLTHAIMDALLGAAALPDIGNHFPPDDPQYEGASSLDLLQHVIKLIAATGLYISNVDATIITERPKIAPMTDEMRKRLSRSLNLAPTRIGIKATTNEGLGLLGREEGIAVLAIAMLDEQVKE